MTEFLVRNEGGTKRFLGRQYEAEKVTHYRHLKEDIDPHIKRVEDISKANSHTNKSEYQYLGSVPRIMIDDWLRKQGKTWNEYATDKELKAKFMVWFKTECQKLQAKTYQERRLSVNRVTAPRLGASILSQYRKEISSGT